MNCRICDSKLETVLDLGRQPRGNGFLSEPEFGHEYFFDLALGVCPDCGTAQLVHQPDAEAMFHGSYPFLTGSSRRMKNHFENLAQDLTAREGLSSRDFVVEIGSNDGTLLSCFAHRGFRHLGIDPSQNVAETARRGGIDTLCAFFDREAAQEIIRRQGRARLFLGTNVLCHIGALNPVLDGIREVLDPGGLAVFEDPYLLDVLEKGSYDQIYDEHAFLFSVRALAEIFRRRGLELVDAERIWTHGGSLRYFAAPAGMRKVSPRIEALCAQEREAGLDRPAAWQAFRRCCEQSREDLTGLVRRLRSEGRRIAGYAATSKSTTVLNYCGFGPADIEYLADTTPAKHGRFSPGTHIPVVPAEEFRRNPPDFAVLFGWNHRQEILENEKEFLRSGGRWIVYVPEVGIL